jgi:hypothetical protein
MPAVQVPKSPVYEYQGMGKSSGSQGQPVSSFWTDRCRTSCDGCQQGLLAVWDTLRDTGQSARPVQLGTTHHASYSRVVCCVQVSS